MEYKDTLSTGAILCERTNGARQALEVNLKGSQEQKQPELLLV
jgi:hypothetical protein